MLLPEAIARYIDASNRCDATAASACFAPEATVRDEEQDHIGIKAIKNWISQTIAKYQPRNTVLEVRNEGERVGLTVRVEGRFPGSPIELEFDFHLHQGKISTLAIQ